MRRYGTCPKCNNSSIFNVKYMPLIKVPEYAEFQPLETFAICLICDNGGVIKREMMPKEIIRGEFWDMEDIEKYKLKETE